MPDRLGWLPPPRRVPLLDAEADLLEKVRTPHGHVCGVGGAPRSERSSCVRRCECGQFYHWSGQLWKPMSLWQLWRHRKMLRAGIDEFLDWS